MKEDTFEKLGCAVVAGIILAAVGVVGFIMWMVYILVMAVAGALN